MLTLLIIIKKIRSKTELREIKLISLHTGPESQYNTDQFFRTQLLVLLKPGGGGLASGFDSVLTCCKGGNTSGSFCV